MLANVPCVCLARDTNKLGGTLHKRAGYINSGYMEGMDAV